MDIIILKNVEKDWCHLCDTENPSKCRRDERKYKECDQQKRDKTVESFHISHFFEESSA